MRLTIDVTIPSPSRALLKRWPLALLGGLAALAVFAASSDGQPALAASTGPRMALTAVGPVSCNLPTEPTSCTATYNSSNPKSAEFQIRVLAVVPPVGGYTAFATEVLPGGMTYNSDTCQDEVVLDNLGATLKGGGAVSVPNCAKATGPAAEIRHAAFIDLLPPLDTTNWTGAVLELDFHCPSNGPFVVTLNAYPAFVFGASYFDAVPAPIGVKAASGVADSLAINCVPAFQGAIINSLTTGWPEGPMGGACYQFEDLTNSETFVVCDNDTAATASQATACGKDNDALDLCTDSDPNPGSIRVALFPGSYDVTAVSAPGHTLDAHLKSCDPPPGIVVKCSFQHTPLTSPWFPWDVTGDGAVAGTDFFDLLQHFGESK